MTPLTAFRTTFRTELNTDPVMASTVVRQEIQGRLNRVDELLHAGEASGRDLLASEQRELNGLHDELRELEEMRAVADSRARASVEADRAALAAAREATILGDLSANPRQERAVITREPRTYDGRPGGPSIFSDMWRAQRMSDVDAQERLQRHQTEARVEQRDVGTGAFGGLVAPAYLVEEFAEVLCNSRALANACRRIPLPASGMSVVIPSGTSGTTVEPQATQNTAVEETDVDFDSDLTVPVQTFAGSQDVSRQALERGTGEIDRLIFADLVGAYASRLDASILNDDGTLGTHLGLENITGENVITYTSASPTVAEFWPKLADAVQQIASNRRQGANLVVVHPRRWGWILAAVDTQDRPLIVGEAGNAVNAMGRGAGDFGEGQLVGTLMGLPVLVDGNVRTDAGAGTDEDVVYVVRRADLLLLEDGDGMPRQLRFEDVGSATLTVKLLAYGYSAFTAERHPEGVSRITGTGLVAPSF